jgi:hypothetical protein
MKLSILTPAIPERIAQAVELSAKIQAQAGSGHVEHLIFCDNRMRSIGAKRQALVDIARGDYVAFCDDDDDISEDYIPSILEATMAGPDVITFHQRAIWLGRETEVHFGLNNSDGPFVLGGITMRAPWHVCAWRRSVVAGCLFGESNYGEDLEWCLQARRRVKTAIHIPRILHTYRHDEKTSAAPPPL